MDTRQTFSLFNNMVINLINKLIKIEIPFMQLGMAVIKDGKMLRRCSKFFKL